MKKESGKTITSLDGKKQISSGDFDRLFDQGSDAIDEYVDWSKARRHGGKRPGAGRKLSPRKPYTLRLKPDTHRRAKTAASAKGVSLSEYIESLIP